MLRAIAGLIILYSLTVSVEDNVDVYINNLQVSLAIQSTYMINGINYSEKNLVHEPCLLNNKIHCVNLNWAVLTHQITAFSKPCLLRQELSLNSERRLVLAHPL